MNTAKALMSPRARPGRRDALPIVVLVLAILALSASSSLAASPWWHLSFEGRPASVQPGVAEDGVQELTIDAGREEGRIRLKSVQVLREVGETEEEGYPEHHYNITIHTREDGGEVSDRELREDLETMWGDGNVEVTGGPKGEGEASWTYVIKVHRCPRGSTGGRNEGRI